MTVYLVGAGPGDPGLVTRRAEELLHRADVVIHDRLVDEGVLALANEGAELIDVGKSAGSAELDQDGINALLIEKASKHRLVVRLKGGDPYVFGRGGEEGESLQLAGIAYEVVPGVSSLTAVPASAGVPLTMRGIASAVTVVSGHHPEAAATDGAPALDWRALARSGATLVVLMGVAGRRAIADRLLAAGRGPSTPVLVVSSGTTPEQESKRCRLDELGGLEVMSPATIVIGEVAAMKLASLEERPLFGWRVVVTRAPQQAGGVIAALAAAGARPILYPTVEIHPPSDGGKALQETAKHLADYEWVVFSSENAVERLFDHLLDARAFGRARVAAIGPATGAALGRRGIVADLVGERYVAEGLLEVFPRAPHGRPSRVLLPRAEVAREVLPAGLMELGYNVDVVEAYRTTHPQPSAANLASLVGADAVLFTSSSTVTGFLATAGRDALAPVIASIGPATSATAHEAGLRIDVEADVHNGEGLVRALCEFAARGNGSPVRGLSPAK